MMFVLIGMAGCGKSCMCKAIGSKLKIKSIDVDKIIEQKYKKKLADIINECGVEEFKKIEEDALLSLAEENAIVSTGGSAVYYDRAMKHLKETGKIIYLYASLETIYKRVGDFSKRGMVMRPDQTIRDVYNERIALYEKYADITIDCDGNAYTKYQNDLINKIKEYL